MREKRGQIYFLASQSARRSFTGMNWSRMSYPGFTMKIRGQQLFRTYSGVQAEGCTLSRKARMKPFITFSVSTSLGSSRDESFNGRLKAED